MDILSGVLPGAEFLTGIASWVDSPESPSGLGHFMLLIDPARLTGKAAFDARMTRFRDTIRSTPPADPAQPVLLPGEIEQRRHAAASKDGIVVPAGLPSRLRDLVR